MPGVSIRIRRSSRAGVDALLIKDSRGQRDNEMEAVVARTATNEQVLYGTIGGANASVRRATANWGSLVEATAATRLTDQQYGGIYPSRA